MGWGRGEIRLFIDIEEPIQSCIITSAKKIPNWLVFPDLLL